MNKPFFSVVMPAYQAEKYLGQSIEGIQSQTFSDWELLIVNDASKDKTPQIAEGYAAQDSRIKVFHQKENRGVSEARNFGIGQAQGRYLWFVDADDKVDEQLLEKVHQSLEKKPAKLVLFGLIEEYFQEDGRLQYANPRAPKEQYLNSQKEVREQMLSLEQQTLYGYPWNKVYDLEYLKKLELNFEDYRTAKFIEDILFNIQYCMDIDSMNLLNCTPYHYAKRGKESLTNEFVPEYYALHRRRIESLWRQQQYWKQETEQTRAVLGGLYARYILSALERNYDKRGQMSRKNRRKFCKTVFHDILFEELVLHARAQDSQMLKLALRIMKTRNVTLNLIFTYCIHIVRTKLPLLYSKTKAGR